MTPIEESGTMQSVGRRSRWLVEIAPLIIGLVSIALYLPGELSTDSVDQLNDARRGIATDWHSPFLTHLWHGLLKIYDSPGSMLIFQQSMYWGGASVLAGGLALKGRLKAAWAVIAVALFPPFVFFNHYILKDVAHYSAMFLASAFCYRAYLGEISKSKGWALLGALTLIAAAMIRMNSAFAVAPLAACLLLPASFLKPVRLAVLIAVSSVILIVAVRFSNANLMQAQPSDIEQSIQLFDLAGIHHFSRDSAVWGNSAVSTAEIDGCYTAFQWDVFGAKGACARLRQKLGADADGHFSAVGIAERKSLWIAAIKQHPAAYLRHRLTHFNSTIFFAVPALHARFNKVIRDGSRPGRNPITAADVRNDYLKKSFIAWPVTWLALGLGLLILLWPKIAASGNARFSAALLISSVCYGAAYAVIGVASDVRYFLWTNLAILLALVVGWEPLRKSWREYTTRRYLLLLLLISVLAIGMYSRLADIKFV